MSDARKFKFIADTSRDFMTLVNREYVYEAANAAYLNAIGKNENELIGKTVSEVWGEEVFRRVISPNFEIAFKGRDANYEAWFDFPARGRGYYSVSYSPYFNDKSEVSHVAVLSHDITRWKLTENALRASEQKFESIVQSLPDIIYRLDSEGRITFINKAVSRYGYTPEELIGQHILNLIHPADRKKGDYRVNERRTGHRKTSCLELQLLTQSGAGVEMEVRTNSLEQAPVLLFDAEGVYKNDAARDNGFVGTQGMARDISAHKRAATAASEREKLYQHMFENTGTGMATVARDGTVLHINSRFEELTGWDMDHVVGTHFSQYIAPHDREQTLQNFKARIEGQDAPKEYEIDMLKRDSSLLRGFAQVGYLSESNQVVVSMVDISALKEAEEEMRRAKEAAEYANKVKDEFLANMSHEVRTPLNGILGMAELALMTELTEEQKEYLDMIRESGKNLLGILNDLLDISKIEAGRLAIDPGPFQVEELARAIETGFRRQAASKNVGFSIALAENMPQQVVVDGIRIRQVLFNLVGNALKFTEKGNVNVYIDHLGGKDGVGPPRMLFSVEDTGMGIPERMVDHIFEPFTQADGSFTRKYQGTGLGLGIVKRLVRLMGGSISVSSEPGKGTAVYFCIPTKDVVSVGEEPKSGKIRASKQALRVLVAEDNPVNRLYAERTVNTLGHSVISVATGYEAVQALSRDQFDVIIMDIQMPKMDGVEATMLIRSGNIEGADKDVPIIAMTAHAMKGDRERFLKAGMNDYIAKPMDMVLLKQAIERVTGI